MNRTLGVGIGVSVVCTLFAACGSAPSTESTGHHGPSAGAGGATATNGFGANAGYLGGGFTSSAAGGTGGEETCAGETSKAELVPLDIYLMLDSSGSMEETTFGGASKWDAITGALSTFFHDASSAGLGVALHRFPTNVAGVPDSCTLNSECPGSTGPCLFKVCSNQPTLTPCSANADCPFGSACVVLGMCGSDYCAPANGSNCSGTSLSCQALTQSVCANADSCNPNDYAAPQIEFSILPAAAAQLDSTMLAVAPHGTTPTGPALEGALLHAKDWAAQHPTHTVVVVLATDGLPTECQPFDIPSIAQIAGKALGQAPAVKTFAIGVFAPADVTAGAQQNLDKIAVAGGTNAAFLVDTTQNVEQQFLSALDAIRGTKLACEFTVPDEGGGGALDFGKVNVEHTPASGSAPVTIGYVGAPEGCDDTTGGWYYDADPATGGSPTKIIMCPATCTGFSLANGGKVEIRVGCKTIFAPPPK